MAADDDWSYAPGSWMPPTSLAHTRQAVEKVGGWRVARDTGRLAPEADVLQRMAEAFGPPQGTPLHERGVPGQQATRRLPHPPLSRAGALAHADPRGRGCRGTGPWRKAPAVRLRHGTVSSGNQGARGTAARGSTAEEELCHGRGALLRRARVQRRRRRTELDALGIVERRVVAVVERGQRGDALNSTCCASPYRPRTRPGRCRRM